MSAVKPYIPNSEAQIALNNMSLLFEVVNAEIDRLEREIQAQAALISTLTERIERLEAQ